MILVVLLSLPFFFILARRPVLRRLALRNASRRPRETMLILLGSMLGTAIITGSFVVGDTLDASMRQRAGTQLGPIDELVLTRDPGVAQDALRKVQALKHPDIDGVMLMPVVTAALSTPGKSPARKAEPNATIVALDFDEARRFGGDESITGIEGPTPAEGHVVLGKDLARVLEVEAGAKVEAHLYGQTLPLVVDRVLPRKGIGGFSQGFSSESFVAFVGRDAVERIAARITPEAAQAALQQAQVSPPSLYVAVSNVGGVRDGAALTPQVKKALESALVGLPVSVQPVKQDLLDLAEEIGRQFTELFGSIGFFSVLAGLLLLVNIFVMLAQERKPEMGMLRAVGLRRASLVGSFSLEGWLYALGSSLIGSLAGLGLGRVIVFVAAGIFASDDEVLELAFTFEGASVQTGFAFGFTISLLTVVITSLGVARINVIRAIRDLPDPETAGGHRRSALIGGGIAALGALLAVTGIGGQVPATTMVGPPLVLAGLVSVLRRFAPRRLLVSVASVLSLAWAVSVFGIFRDTYENADIANFVVMGVVLTASAVALVSQNQDVIGSTIRRLAGGGRAMALRLGLAYPLARRFRTGMILSMYSLVVFTLTFITVFSHLFGGQIETFTKDVGGGFDLSVRSNGSNPVPPAAITDRPEVEAVGSVANTFAQFDAPPLSEGFENWYVTGFDATVVDRGAPALDDLGEHESVEAAYSAILADPGLAIVSEFFMQNGGGPPEASLHPGDGFMIKNPSTGATRKLTVTAISKGSFANDRVVIGIEGMRTLFGDQAVVNELFVDVKPGVDPQAFAEQINGEYVPNGADADSFRTLVNRNLSGQQAFFRLMQGYLALGLVVGIAGLGVVMVRAVRERRRQIGVLRSLGYESSMVRRAFLAESSFVALEGIAIGTILAIVTAWQIVANDVFGPDLPFSIPWLTLAGLIIGTAVASLLATAAPANQASKIRPAIALRMTD